MLQRWNPPGKLFLTLMSLLDWHFVLKSMWGFALDVVWMLLHLKPVAIRLGIYSQLL